MLGLSFAVWVVGFFVISPLFQNVGYLAFQRWEMVSPTLITLFLYVRAVRREESRRQKVRAHVAWLATVAVVVYLGRQAWLGYQAVDDAPRGLLWDGYQFAALLLGTTTYWICTALTSPLSRPPGSERGARDQAAAVESKPGEHPQSRT